MLQVGDTDAADTVAGAEEDSDAEACYSTEWETSSNGEEEGEGEGEEEEQEVRRERERGGGGGEGEQEGRMEGEEGGSWHSLSLSPQNICKVPRSKTFYIAQEILTTERT